MAGHSQFKNIMYRKGVQDARRARMFAKLAREITVACRTGLPQVEMNPRLRAAISAARDQNMPKDSIERAIQKAKAVCESTNYEEVRYEGYGPGGITVIIEALTDNRNRTAAKIRTAFDKNGGTLGESNSVIFNFERVGMLRYPTSVASDEPFLEAAIEAGASDVGSNNNGYWACCAPEDLGDIMGALEQRFGAPKTAQLEWRPLMMITISDENIALSLLRFLELLEENEDVQQVVANFDIPEVLMERLVS